MRSSVPSINDLLIPFIDSSSFTHPYHGHFRHRLGLPIILRPSRFWSLGSDGTSLVYQCKGITSLHRPMSGDVIHTLSFRIMLDNTTGVHCIRHQGTFLIPTLLKVSKNLLAYRCSIYLTVAHLAGTSYMWVDALFRQASSSVLWHLKPSLFAHLTRRFGVPQVFLCL